VTAHPLATLRRSSPVKGSSLPRHQATPTSKPSGLSSFRSRDGSSSRRHNESRARCLDRAGHEPNQHRRRTAKGASDRHLQSTCQRRAPDVRSAAAIARRESGRSRDPTHFARRTFRLMSALNRRQRERRPKLWRFRHRSNPGLAPRKSERPRSLSSPPREGWRLPRPETPSSAERPSTGRLALGPQCVPEHVNALRRHRSSGCG